MAQKQGGSVGDLMSTVGSIAGGPIGGLAGSVLGSLFGGSDKKTQSFTPQYQQAYNTNYWAENAPENQYMQRNMQQLATDYGQKRREVQGNLNQQMAGQPGSLSQFAQSQNVDIPEARARSEMYNNQYNKRWEGEQNQYNRQGNWNVSQAGNDQTQWNAGNQAQEGRNQGAANTFGQVGNALQTFGSKTPMSQGTQQPAQRKQGSYFG